MWIHPTIFKPLQSLLPAEQRRISVNGLFITDLSEAKADWKSVACIATDRKPTRKPARSTQLYNDLSR